MKILEFLYKESLAPVGGPLGYVYSLYKFDNDNKNLFFLENSHSNQVNAKSKKRTNAFIKTFLRHLSFLKLALFGSRSKAIELENYDVVHFHSTLDLYKYRRSLKRFKGKIVLTSHSPTLASVEKWQEASLIERILFWPVYALLKHADKQSFRLSNYIVFPCPYAEEPYVHYWKGFSRFKNKYSKKFKYLLTGTYKRTPRTSVAETREKLGIPATSKVICYVGRHNKTKGFDILKTVASKVLSSTDDVYFVIVGKESPIKGLKNERWIEVGWNNDPHSFIAASDLFVLPNRETYFDLIMLEVLSLGKIVVASRTGGNKFFDNDNYPGVLEYDSIDDCVSTIRKVLSLSDEKKKELSLSNYSAFETTFTDAIFYDNYIELMKTIIN